MSHRFGVLAIAVGMGAALGGAVAWWTSSTPAVPDPTPTDEPRQETRRNPARIEFAGRVRDSFEAPVPHALVIVEPVPDSVAIETRDSLVSAETTTDRNGAFQLSLPRHDLGYAITVVHREFPVHTEWLTGDPDSAHDLAVRLRSGSGLAITVQSADTGRMLSDARVSIQPTILEATLPPRATAARIRTITTDSHGIALLDSAPECGLMVRIEAEGHATLERHVVDPSGVLPVRLEAAHVLRGRVVNGTGAPVEGATVRAGPESGGATHDATTHAGGDFRIPGLARGRYIVTVDTAHFGSLEVLGIPVPSPTVHDLRLPPLHDLDGKVVDASGAPVRALLRIEPLGSELGKPRLTRCNDAGEFSIREVPAGRYAIHASSEASLSVPTRVVTVPADPVELQLRVETAVSGRLADSDGVPQEGAKVNLMASRGDNSTFGRFASEALGGTPAVAVQRAATVRGSVHRADGSPAAGARIGVRPVANGETEATMTTADYLGRFSLGPVPAGDYEWLAGDADEELRRLESSRTLTMPKNLTSRHVLVLR